jgi:hypothetical protein
MVDVDSFAELLAKLEGREEYQWACEVISSISLKPTLELKEPT